MDKYNTLNIINGKEVLGEGVSIMVYNPATGEEIQPVMAASPAQAQVALDAADAAFKTWSKLSLAQREAHILAFADTLVAHREEIIAMLIEETGKSYGTAAYDFDMIPNCLRYFIEEAKSMNGAIIPDYEGNHLSMVIRKPLGVVAGYLAWNFPLLNLGYKLGPALAAGCTCVLKPSTQTPIASLYVGKLAIESGMPAGVINIIAGTGDDISAVLNTSPITQMITLIGSSATGAKIIRESSNTIKHYSLELGGNAPVMVMKDADYAFAAACVVGAKTENGGQICVAPNRVFVHADIAEPFIAELKKQVARVSFGSGTDAADILMAPMVSKRAQGAMQALVDDAVAKGATIEAGGTTPDCAGYFYDSTILTGVTKEMRVYQEEIFGPIIPVIVFDDNDDAVALANDTEYGLAAYVYTKDLDTAMKLSREIDSGSVCVNEPFYNFNLPHGGCKQSGVGKDCSTYSLEEYTYLQRIAIKL